jgi:hypothetical protein
MNKNHIDVLDLIDIDDLLELLRNVNTPDDVDIVLDLIKIQKLRLNKNLQNHPAATK